MKTMESRINKYVVALSLAALMIGAATGIRSGELPHPASNTKPTNVISRYVEAVQEAIISGTAATNLSEVERRLLMNESIKTDLAAQLWFRQAMVGTMSHQGAKMAGEIRVLENLRAGRTKDAIRDLEESLDSDIMGLATYLRLSDETKSFKPTIQPIKALQQARAYRLQFPHQSGDQAADDRVKDALSYLDKK